MIIYSDIIKMLTEKKLSNVCVIPFIVYQLINQKKNCKCITVELNENSLLNYHSYQNILNYHKIKNQFNYLTHNYSTNFTLLSVQIK